MTAPTHGSSLVLGERIRILRDLRGWSQADFSYHTGLDHECVREVEMGTHDPTLDTLGVIAGCLGVTTSELLDGIERL